MFIVNAQFYGRYGAAGGAVDGVGRGGWEVLSRQLTLCPRRRDRLIVDSSDDIAGLNARRYRRAVGAWNIVSGLHAGAAFSLSFEQIIELTRLLVAHVKTMLPQARTLISITQPFGEYHASEDPAEQDKVVAYKP